MGGRFLSLSRAGGRRLGSGRGGPGWQGRLRAHESRAAVGKDIQHPRGRSGGQAWSRFRAALVPKCPTSWEWAFSDRLAFPQVHFLSLSCTRLSGGPAERAPRGPGGRPKGLVSGVFRSAGGGMGLPRNSSKTKLMSQIH